ncbi:MAG TPA: sulfate ABC transporter ATP-binding protein [Candidatus Deferrimicrobiaceae bacterium]|jgi:sulfate transport system ATP-binding protein
MSIAIDGLTKHFGDYAALDDICLDVPDGELVALLGPSGSGKTTLLRIIAGLEAADRGRVLFDGTDVTDTPLRERKIGFVFQHYALFRHMTVAANVAFGLSVRPRKDRPSKGEIRDRVRELLRLVQLDGFADRYPSQLSGGQRQRIALARALAVQPKVLLLDEPFGALDAQVRQELRRWLRRLHDEIHVTSVFVTHDQEEALEVADRIVVMNKGKVEQAGTPDEVYDHPASPFVLNFLGRVNLFRGRIHEGRALIGDASFDAPEHADADNAPGVGYVRSHDLEIERGSNGSDSLPAEVRHIRKLGPMVRVGLTLAETGEALEAELTREQYRRLEIRPGEHVFLRLRNVRVFTADYQI